VVSWREMNSTTPTKMNTATARTGPTKHHGHHAGAHVGAQHHGQRGRQAHQALADERRNDEAVAVLDCTRP
jgi:hypothetical protein